MFEVAGSFVLIDAAKIAPPALDAGGASFPGETSEGYGRPREAPLRVRSRLQASATTLLPRLKCVHKGRRDRTCVAWSFRRETADTRYRETV